MIHTEGQKGRFASEVQEGTSIPEGPNRPSRFEVTIHSRRRSRKWRSFGRNRSSGIICNSRSSKRMNCSKTPGGMKFPKRSRGTIYSGRIRRYNLFQKIWRDHSKPQGQDDPSTPDDQGEDPLQSFRKRQSCLESQELIVPSEVQGGWSLNDPLQEAL